VNATPVKRRDGSGLVMVKLRLVLPFSGMLAAPNDLLMVGGIAASTVKVSVAVPPVAGCSRS